MADGRGFDAPSRHQGVKIMDNQTVVDFKEGANADVNLADVVIAADGGSCSRNHSSAGPVPEARNE
jgi:hypothetical protein